MERIESSTFYYLEPEDKHYFAGFFNTACMNICDVNNELYNQYLSKKAPQKNERAIEQIFHDKMSITDYEQWVKRIADYFPVATLLDEKYDESGNFLQIETRVQRFRANLLLLVTAVDNLRNFYTHLNHPTPEIKDDTYRLIDRLLLSTAKTVQGKYLKNDKTREMLKKQLGREFEELKKEHRHYLQEKQGKKNIPAQEVENGVYNNAMLGILGKNKTLAPNASSLRRKDEPNISSGFRLHIKFSQSGIIFLLSIFLLRKQLEELFAHTRGFKGTINSSQKISCNNNSLRNMITRRVYSYWAYKGLKKKLRTDEEYTPITLAMQMLDELSKVPHEVYEQLDEAQQDTFRVDLNEYYKDTCDGKVGEKVVHPVIRKRYDDKFGYFAVRFLDEYVGEKQLGFKSLRFQVYLGDYIHHSQGKEVGTRISQRCVKEKITVFGRLSELCQKKAVLVEKLEELQAENQQSYWQIFPNPSYNFPTEVDVKHNKVVPAGKIGIWVQLDDKYRSILQNARASQHSPRQNRTSKDEIIRQVLGDGFHSGQPIAYLSLQDMYAIVYTLLNEKEGLNLIEGQIIRQIKKQIDELVKDKDCSNSSNEVIKYEKIKQELQNELKRSEEYISQLERLKSEREESATYCEQILSPAERGRVATLLANDLKKLMLKTARCNWKSVQHNELQKGLAYYSSENRKYLQELLKVSGEPRFSRKQCWKANTLYGFAIQYLQARKAWLQQLLNEYNPSPEFADKCFDFLNRRNFVVKNKVARMQQALAHPIALKTGFLGNASKMTDEKWYRAYTDKTIKFQDFYNQNLVAQISEKIHEKSEKSRFIRRIHRLKRQDYSMLQMALHILIKELSVLNCTNNVTFTLNDLYPQMGDATPTAVWSRLYNLSLGKQIVANSVKLKDIGNYLAFVKDVRVKAILSYNEGLKWEVRRSEAFRYDHETLEGQIDAYNNYRRRVLNTVHLIESIVARYCSTEKDLQNKENFRQDIQMWLKYRHGREILLKYRDKYKDGHTMTEEEYANLEQQCSHDEQNGFVVVTIRNCFAHNELPSQRFFKYCCKKFPEKYGDNSNNMVYSKFFFEVLEQAAQKMDFFTHLVEDK